MSEKEKRLKAAIKKQNETKGLGGSKTDVNQAIEEKNRKNPRRIKASDVLTAGSMLVGGPIGGAALKAGSKIIPKVIKKVKDVGSSTIGTAKLQPKRGAEYRTKKDKLTGRNKISGISNNSTNIAKGIRGSVKTGTGAAGLALVGGNKPKDKVKKKKINVATPKPRPSSIKPKKKEQFMKESSGLRKDDNKKLKDSKVKFKSEVIKRKK